jgi:acyl-CoA synthetase (AMP-forming)/AMP-acid ligase II
MNVAHLLVSQALRRPDAKAIVESTAAISFSQLDERSARCARFLAERGVGIGDHVLVFVPMSIELYLALIAIFRIGAVATFLDPSAGRDHIDRCCEAVEPKAMIAVTKAHLLRLSAGALRAVPRKFTVGWPVPGAGKWERARRTPPLAAIAPREDEDPALVTFTSGSTGWPKGAVRSHGFLAAQHAALERAIELVPGEIDLATLPIFSLANLASGVTSVIPDSDLRRPGAIEAEPVLKQITQSNVTRCVASPAFFERLLEQPDAQARLRSITRVFTGGAPVFPDLLERLQNAMPQARVAAVYGSTEAEPIAHVHWSEISPDDWQAMFNGAGLLAGRPLGDIDLRIISDQWGWPLSPATHSRFESHCLPARQPGEIIVHGKHVLRGYLGGKGDEKTKWRVDGEVWHRTGDAGYLDERGRLWLLGRAEAKIEDEQGTVYPFAVECAASRVHGVVRSALIRHENKRVLAIQAASDAAADLGDVLLRELAWAKIQRIHFVPMLPLDRRHNAKIDYPALRKLLSKSPA